MQALSEMKRKIKSMLTSGQRHNKSLKANRGLFMRGVKEVKAVAGQKTLYHL